MIDQDRPLRQLKIESDLEGKEWALVQRIVASPAFVRSSFLTKFLLYICDRKLRGHEDEITEYQIGIYALGRPDTFHTGEDNIVRNYARLLRKKLAGYFQNEGESEELILEIPKGHYLPVFVPRNNTICAAVQPAASPEIEAEAELDLLPEGASATDPAFASPAIPAPSSSGFLRKLLLAGGIFLLGLAAGMTFWMIPGSRTAAREKALDRLWAPFWKESPPLVIYSNALFVGNQVSGMHYADRATENAEYVRTYTGVGDTQGVYDLTRLFDRHHAAFTLKRSLLVTWDEAKQKNLVFIGSVAQNSALRIMPDSMDFVITAENGFSGIQNRHPKPGEPAVFSKPEQPFTKDYAILAYIPALEPDRKALIFSGLTTFGTQAAVEFGSTDENVEQLLRAAAGPNGSIRPFEAILETTLGGDVPLQSRLVAIHVH